MLLLARSAHSAAIMLLLATLAAAKRDAQDFCTPLCQTHRSVSVSVLQGGKFLTKLWCCTNDPQTGPQIDPARKGGNGMDFGFLDFLVLNIYIYLFSSPQR